MSSNNDQYDISGTKPSWRHWKRALKRSTARLFRRASKRIERELPARATAGWVD